MRKRLSSIFGWTALRNERWPFQVLPLWAGIPLFAVLVTVEIALLTAAVVIPFAASFWFFGLFGVSADAVGTGFALILLAMVAWGTLVPIVRKLLS